MVLQYRNDFFLLNQWEYFEFLVKQDSEEKKQIEDLYRIMEDRVNIEDQYLKGIERVITGLEQLSLKGGLGEFVNGLIGGQKEKLSVGRSYLFLVKKDSLETIRDLLKKQAMEIKVWISEQKKLEKEYRYSLDRCEKLRIAYVSQAKECDLIGLEVQTMNVNREVSSERRIRSTQKHIEFIKQKVDNEETYQAKVLDHNNLLERFRMQLEGFNRSLLEFKASSLQAVKQGLGRFLDFEKTQALIYSNTIEPLYTKLDAIDTQQITRDQAGIFSTTKNFPSKIAPVIYHSFFQQAWNELQAQLDTRSKEIITTFRSFHENVIKSEEHQPFGDFECEGLEQEERDNISLVSHVIDSAWRGEEQHFQTMQKFQQLLREKFIRSIFVAGLQQYRLAGKFCLTTSGFKNMKTILYLFLDDCLTAKDVISTTKLMILSLTFWKLINQGKQEEKKYLQASIKWHPLWKELDFWMAAIFMSIHEEVVNKRSYKLEEQESEKETRERQKAIVCGQLLSYVHNMASFGVEKVEIKRIIKMFCQYYSLEEVNVKEIMATCEEISSKKENVEMVEALAKENRAPKKKGLDSIRDFFIKRNSNETYISEVKPKNSEELTEIKSDKKASEILKAECETTSEISTLGSAEDT